MKKLLSLLLALAMFAGLALPAMAEEPVTIEFWYSFENQMVEQIMTVIAAFEEANPGIKVKPTYAGSYNESNQKLLAAHAAALGLRQEKTQELLSCVMCDDALRILREEGLYAPLLSRLAERIEVQLQHKCGPMAAGAIVFSKEYGCLCQTAQAQALLEKIKEN